MIHKADMPKSILKKVSQFDCDFFERNQNNDRKHVKLIRFSFEVINQPLLGSESTSVRKEPNFSGKRKKKLRAKESETVEKRVTETPISQLVKNPKELILNGRTSSDRKTSSRDSVNEILEKPKTPFQKIEEIGIGEKDLNENTAGGGRDKPMEKKKRERKKRRRKKRGSRTNAGTQG